MVRELGDRTRSNGNEKLTRLQAKGKTGPKKEPNETPGKGGRPGGTKRGAQLGQQQAEAAQPANKKIKTHKQFLLSLQKDLPTSEHPQDFQPFSAFGSPLPITSLRC